MRRLLALLLLAPVLPILAVVGAHAAQSAAAASQPDRAVVSSPKGHVSVTVSLRSGELFYDVSDGGVRLLDHGRLGLSESVGGVATPPIDTGIGDPVPTIPAIPLVPGSPLDLADRLTWGGVGKQRTVTQDYPLVGAKQTHVHSVATERDITVKGADGTALTVDMRTWDDGFAFRYHVAGAGSGVVADVTSEATTFPVLVPKDGGQEIAQPQTANGPDSQEWYLPRGWASSAFRSIGTEISSAGTAFPLLFKDQRWMLFSEVSGDASYPYTYLNATSPIVRRDGHRWATYSIGFPPDSNDGTGPGDPQESGAWDGPWRFMSFGRTLPQIYASTAETDLAKPATFTDTSWIKPGNSSWTYIKDSDVPRSLPQFEKFIALAKQMHWPYVALDDGWPIMTDQNGIPMLAEGLQIGLLKQVVDIAAQSGIKVVVWFSNQQLLEPTYRQTFFAELESIGVAGVKIDKWNSDKQQSVDERSDMLADAAKYHLMVDMHNVQAPRGLERTYPNLVGVEGGESGEFYRQQDNNADQGPEVDVESAIVRGIFGTFEFGPVLMREPHPDTNPRRTTAAHELATSITYFSALRPFADDEAGYGDVPAKIKAYLSSVPTTWSQSRLLAANVGADAVVARKHGNAWWIGAVNGKTTSMSSGDATTAGYQPPTGAPITFHPDLSKLGCTGGTLYADGRGEAHDGLHLVTSHVGVHPRIRTRPFGGFVIVAKHCR